MKPLKMHKFLRRYTSLPALIEILSSKKITLLDPGLWDDKNDAYFMAQYKNKEKLKTLLALCFTQGPETYHHWHVFAGGAAGVCIEFDGDALLASLLLSGSFKHGQVKYLNLNQAKSHKFRVNDLPFLKRSAFEPEAEFRLIYESSKECCSSLSLPIKIKDILKVSLSPWMVQAMSKTVAQAVRSINGCSKLRISRSTLISNEQWKAYAKLA